MNVQVEETRVEARAMMRHEVIPGIGRPKALFMLRDVA